MDKPLTYVAEAHSVVFLQDRRIAVAGRRSCIIFDQDSQQPIRTIKTNQLLFDIAPNKNKTLLTLSINYDVPIIYNVKTNEHNSLKEHEDRWCACTTFGSMSDAFFTRSGSTLYCYDASGTKIKEFDLPDLMAPQAIACHPTKNELLYASIWKHLTIAQPGHTLRPIAHLHVPECEGASYAPDGNTIIIWNRVNKERNYAICNLNSQENTLLAYQLIADAKDYIASTFCNSIVALLSKDSYVHFFDYITHINIARTKQLAPNTNIDDYSPHKRLDCDEQGKHLAVALRDTWQVIDIPQNNLFVIWKALHHKQRLPTEVVKIIVCNIINAHEQAYEFFDLGALLSTTLIQPVMSEVNNDEDSVQLEPQTKKIITVYGTHAPQKSTKFLIPTK